MNDEEETQLFGTSFGKDPANDNYSYFRSTEYDNSNASILTRYKKFNNTQGNSPTNNLSTESYPTSATSYPDTEDIDKDHFIFGSKVYEKLISVLSFTFEKYEKVKDEF